MESNARAGTPIDSVMRSRVVSIEKDATLRSAATLLRENDVGTLAIMDGVGISGILSERDIVRSLADGADPDAVQVAQVMSREPRYLTAGEDLESAARTMLAVGIRHLPVVDEGEVVGIVSIRDLMAALRS